MAQRGGEVFLQGEAAIRRLIEGLPADFRAAVDVAIAANKARQGHANDEGIELPPTVDPTAPRVWRPPLTPLARWREPIPGLPEEAWPDMVTLPAGRFLMGAPEGEEGSRDDERPQREVTVPRPFALGRVAVTFAQWDEAVAAGFVPPRGPAVPEDQGWGRGDRPVIEVSWEVAQDYCSWLNHRLELPEGTYRLPSEAEWEYACRACTVTAFSFGRTITKKQVTTSMVAVTGRLGARCRSVRCRRTFGACMRCTEMSSSGARTLSLPIRNIRPTHGP